MSVINDMYDYLNKRCKGYLSYKIDTYQENVKKIMIEKSQLRNQKIKG